MDYIVILFLAWTLVSMALGAFVATLFRKSDTITNHIHMWPEPAPQDDDPADAWKRGNES